MIITFHLLSLLRQRRLSSWKYRKWCSYFENRYHHAKIVNKRVNFFGQPLLHLVIFQKKHIKFSEVAFCPLQLPNWLHYDRASISALKYCQCYSNKNIKNTAIKTLKQKHLYQLFGCLRLTLGHWKGDTLTHPMLITALFQVRPEYHQEPRS